MRLKQILNVVALIAMLVVNYLAGSVGINGLNSGEVSDAVPSLFTPAGYVFAIWGLIYLGLTAFTVYQALPAQRDRPLIEQIGYWFVISSLLNIAWLFLWHYLQFPLSLLAMLCLLGSLIAIYLRLDIGRGNVSRQDKLLVHVPFSVYLGWISVATIANASIVLYKLGWNGFGIAPEVWTVLMVVIAAILGIAMIVLRSDIAFALVIVWALVGIAVARAGMQAIVIAAGLSALAVVIAIVWNLVRNRAG
jgi:benzodiazapine receptor